MPWHLRADEDVMKASRKASGGTNILIRRYLNRETGGTASIHLLAKIRQR